MNFDAGTVFARGLSQNSPDTGAFFPPVNLDRVPPSFVPYRQRKRRTISIHFTEVTMSGDFGKWLTIALVALVVVYAVFHVAALRKSVAGQAA